MSLESETIEMFFFPYLGGGHQIPMIDIARVFASHGAKSTILTTQPNFETFQKSIENDQKSGHPISIQTLDLPENVESPDFSDMSASPHTDTSMLIEPLKRLLLDVRPDCIVIDMFHRWSRDVIDELGVPRVVFNGNGCFSKCVMDNIRIHKPHEGLYSKFDSFVVPGIPDRIEMTISQLPHFSKSPGGGSKPPGKMVSPENGSFGAVVNSFYKLEPAYADYLKRELGAKVWLVGPVSLCNRNVKDKTVRGIEATVDENSCLSWLNSKEPHSVLYLSFGSAATLTTKQLYEIACGLEASGHSFIWVVGKIYNLSQKGEKCEENWLPSGFEERVRESKRGLIIRGWAPQLLILEHPSVGGFMTHCGWNSTLEGVSSGLPMITFPLTAEQFANQKLITDVLKIGVKSGSIEWSPWSDELIEPVGRDKIEMAVKSLMGGSDEALEMRKRAKELGVKAKRAVEEGGSSYADAEALIQELKSLRKVQACMKT